MKKSLIFLLQVAFIVGFNIDDRLILSGDNKIEIEKAIINTPDHQLPGMIWLINNMPEDDLKILSSEFLLTNCDLAYNVWTNMKWGENIPENIFFDGILPYANLNERRDNWRKDFYNKFFPVVKDCKSSYEGAALLNQKIFEMIGVIYSTKRPKADQSPYESIDAGMASCTGLSILLIDACRSVGIPARFVGTPSWYNDSGNHSWVEIWDDGWHFTGAAEPTELKLDEGWFLDLAAQAKKGDIKYGIFAVTWGSSDLYFPMDWLPGVKKYKGIDITDRYTNRIYSDELVPIRFRALNENGLREAIRITISGDDNLKYEGISKDQTCDLNDHLTFMLPRGKTFEVRTGDSIKMINVTNEEIIDLKYK
tara:strand:- start:30 stop:1127 length:1098 start_codon:yes stop_codon:yes gene_type:complete